MTCSRHSSLAAACAAALSCTAAAADDPPVRLDPPRLDYRSAFTPTVRHSDAAPIEWSRSNALVGALGGHAGHLRGRAPAPEGDDASTPPRARGAHDAHGHGAGAVAR